MIRTLGKEGTCMPVQVIHAVLCKTPHLGRLSPVTEKTHSACEETGSGPLLRAIGAVLMVIG